MPAEVSATLVHSADERIPVADLELGVRWLRHAAQRHARLARLPWAMGKKKDEDEEGPARRDGARERRARARAAFVGVRDPARRRDDRGRVRAQAAAGVADPEPAPARPGAAAEALAASSAGEAEAAGGEAADGEPGRRRRRCSARRVVVRVLRESRLRPVARELLSGLVSIAPAVLALRGGELASYHGAEHIAIGTYEHGKPATKEHERCGGHLVGPLLVTSAIGNTLAGLAPGALAPPGAGRRADRRDRRGDRAVRLDVAQPGASARPRPLEAGPRAPAPLLDRGADARISSRSPRPRSPRASSSKHA